MWRPETNAEKYQRENPTPKNKTKQESQIVENTIEPGSWCDSLHKIVQYVVCCCGCCTSYESYYEDD